MGLTELKDLKSQLRFEIVNQLENDVDVVKVVPQERPQQRAVECISERINEQTADVPVPQIVGEITAVVKLFLQERRQHHVVERVVDVLAR